MNIVIDTNVLISALWSANSKPAAIINNILACRFLVCYDYRILNEYYNVIRRPKFSFKEWEVEGLLTFISKNGISVIAPPLPGISFKDNSDKKFYEVAKFCRAPLITGNIKDYPRDSIITSVADFYQKYIHE